MKCIGNNQVIYKIGLSFTLQEKREFIGPPNVMLDRQAGIYLYIVCLVLVGFICCLFPENWAQSSVQQESNTMFKTNSKSKMLYNKQLKMASSIPDESPSNGEGRVKTERGSRLSIKLSLTEWLEEHLCYAGNAEWSQVLQALDVI